MMKKQGIFIVFTTVPSLGQEDLGEKRTQKRVKIHCGFGILTELRYWKNPAGEKPSTWKLL